MNARENYIRAARVQYPEYVPCSVHFYPSTWRKHREKLDDIVLRYPHLFETYQSLDEMPCQTREFGNAYRKGEYYTDPWGCIWYNIYDGLKGQVVKSPLEDWNSLDSYKVPDLLVWNDYGPVGDWGKIQANIEKMRQKGHITKGGVSYLYQRLTFLRGFKNLMLDFFREPPQLSRLIDMIVDEKLRLIHKLLETSVDVIVFIDDLGTQKSLQISPATFRRYLKPAYYRMIRPCLEADRIVYFHSDGHILELIDDFIDLGATIVNPQFGANDLDGLIQKWKGRICIDLDLNRQFFPFAKPQQIKDHVKEAVTRLGSEEGGLMLLADCAPDVPLANIEAICHALDEYRFYCS